MKNLTRIKEIFVKNIKNVKEGKVITNSTFESMDTSDIIGFYGQNGSGKTTIVEAMSVLKNLLNFEELPNNREHLIASGSDSVELCFAFLIRNNFGEYTVNYSVILKSGENKLEVIEEKISYKENIKRKRFKEIIVKNKNEISIRNKELSSFLSDQQLEIMLANKISLLSHTSFVFRKELREVLEKILTEEEIEIFNNLTRDFNRDFHIIDNKQNGLILANLIMPVSVHLKEIRGKIPYGLNESMVLPVQVFEFIKKVVEQINCVLSKIVPNLTIIVNPISKETLEDSTEGIRFEFLSEKNGIVLPLRCESDGTLKLISILSTLIAVYNNPNACVVIDELDSGVFEYLLGEILEVLQQGGKGQLFFTSHNLRILEVLDNKNLWFTTNNENNRYIQLKGIKSNNNLRDVYIRGVQLGGQAEELYAETRQYDIKKGFRRAEKVNA